MPPRPLPELVSFLESLAEPHILCDTAYRIVAANAAYRRTFGEERVAVGRTCFEVSHRIGVPCDQAGETCPLQQSLRSGQRERVLHLHHTAGGEAYVGIELSPIRDGGGEIAYFIEKIEPLEVARGLSAAHGLVGRAPAFQHMLQMVARVAPAEAAVLLQGESGSGKELLAKAIHDASRRAAGPFVTVDCSGLPETLFESELFGHERGAFTGATARRSGLVAAASGGTLFLDEVGDIPLVMQVKLLRLLETGTYRPVGTAELSKADIRLISATHRDLRAMVEAGSFRQDLFFRINTFPIALPALRERREDIPLLVESLLARVAPGRPLRIAPSAMALLVEHDYPGNVRELRNVLERASLLCDGELIHPEHLPEEVRGAGAALRHGPSAAAGPAPQATLEDLQLDALRRRLARFDGSRKALARELGVSERTLYRKLKQLESPGRRGT
jgi:two-component system response regulator HydG